MTPTAEARRRIRRHPLAKMYYRLRTRRDTPRQKALAVLAGVIVGCTPFFGLHLVMCIALARITGLNVVTTYLASYINNPLVAPFTLYLALGVGRLLFTGEWPALNFEEAQATGVWRVGRDVLVGSLIVGVALGSVLSLIVYLFSSRHAKGNDLERRLTADTAHRYLASGIFAWEFARGKLKYDPIYRHILKTASLPREGRLLDLGCGGGILLCLLQNAAKLYARGQWQSEWPPPPTGLALAGVEARATYASVARRALVAGAQIYVEDLRAYQPTACEVVTLVDVLHYLPRGSSKTCSRAWPRR